MTFAGFAHTWESLEYNHDNKNHIKFCPIILRFISWSALGNLDNSSEGTLTLSLPCCCTVELEDRLFCNGANLLRLLLFLWFGCRIGLKLVLFLSVDWFLRTRAGPHFTFVSFSGLSIELRTSLRSWSDSTCLFFLLPIFWTFLFILLFSKRKYIFARYSKRYMQGIVDVVSFLAGFFVASETGIPMSVTIPNCLYYLRVSLECNARKALTVWHHA